MRSAVTRFIVLAGAADSGKTTLLTSLYESFQWGSFAGYVFAGSQTLPGLERRCHLSRIASGRAKPDTERTKPGEELLHLRVRVKDLSRPAQELVITDLFGEAFRMAKDSTEECKRLGFISRADHFVLLLDGEKIAETGRRQEAFTDGSSLLRSCLDASMLLKNSYVDVLFTKWDKIECNKDNEKRSEALAFVEHITTNLTQRFGNRVGRIRFFRVAARPEKNTLPFAYELDKVFPAWVEESPIFAVAVSSPALIPSSGREIDRYHLRLR